MKKINLFALILAFDSLSLLAQYGDNTYPHMPNSFLTSAKKSTVGNGYLMAHVYPFIVGNAPDFTIERVDQDGNLTGFNEEYRIWNFPSCGGGSWVPQTHMCTGVDIVETNPGSGINYAIAGAYGKGVFFATLDINGNIVAKQFFNIGAGATNVRPTITEDVASGKYYITGNNGSQMYIFKVDLLGNYIWGKFYANALIEPRDMLISPFNTSELIIVGRSQVGAQTQDAFFMSVNKLTGAVNSFNTYYDGPNGDEWFNAITVCNSSPGFVIGGRGNSSNPSGVTWVLKVDPAGNINWSNLINRQEEIFDIEERYNPYLAVPVSQQYQYFAVTKMVTWPSINNVVVWKLDYNGDPVVGNPNEFIYQMFTYSGGTDLSLPQIETVGDGTAAGDGFAAFGTNLSNNRNYLFKAYYNGVEGCEQTSDISASPNAPTQVNLNIVANSVYPVCTIDFQHAQTSVSPVTNCGWFPTIGGGTNLPRSADYTGIAENTTSKISVSPNPTANSIKINLEGAGCKLISVTNSLGQIVYRLDLENQSSNNAVVVDFESMNFSNGLYTLNCQTDEGMISQKILFNK